MENMDKFKPEIIDVEESTPEEVAQKAKDNLEKFKDW